MKKRLVYVKALYLHGKEHAKSEAEFDRMIALHHFDNAVELLLKCIATSVSANIGRNVTFPALWDEVERKLQERSISLQKRTEMQQLHDVRSDIQHWGAANLSLDAVNRYQVYSGDFIQTTIKDVFDVDFEEMSLSLLVRDVRIREFLSKAERTLDKDPQETMKCSSVAYSLAENKELARVNLQFSSLSLALGPEDKNRLQLVDRDAGSLAETLGNIWETEIRGNLDTLKEVIRLLVLGIPIDDYSKYKKVAPMAAIFDKVPRFQLNFEGGYAGDFSKENAVFCFNFVLRQVLRWQEKW